MLSTYYIKIFIFQIMSSTSKVVAWWWVLAHTVECISKHIIWIVNHFNFLPWPTNILGNHFLVYKTFKIEIQKRGPNNSDILQNWFPPQIRSPFFNLQKLQDSEKSLPHSCRMDWNLMNDEEFGSIELLRLKYRRGDQIIQTFFKTGSPQKLNPRLFNLYKFENPERSTPESYKMHWKLIDGEEFGSEKPLKLKFRRGDQIIQTFSKSGSP